MLGLGKLTALRIEAFEQCGVKLTMKLVRKRLSQAEGNRTLRDRLLKEHDSLLVQIAQRTFKAVLVSEDCVEISHAKILDGELEVWVRNMREKVLVDVAARKSILDKSNPRAREIVGTAYFD